MNRKYFNYLPTSKINVVDYILFVFYLLLFCWLVTQVPFIKKSGLNNRYIVVLFLVKIAAGLAIGWLSYFMDTKNDYWIVNREAWIEYQLLFSNPKEYFTNIFQSHYTQGYGGLFDSFQSFWNDLRNNIIIKFISVCNIFTRGNYYSNSICFNFFCFLGHVAFYRVFIQIFKKQQVAVIIGCFLLPSMLYFTSGIQKDGIIFITLGFLSYAVFQSLQQNSFSKKRIVIIVLGFVSLFLIRSYVLLNLLPPLVLWILVAKFKWPALKTFVIGYIIIGLIFFNFNSIVHSFNPLKTVSDKQAAFFTLPIANTQIKTDTLYPTFKSFISNAPQAYNHLLFRPYIDEVSVKSLLPINAELALYQILFLLFLFFRRKKEAGEYNPFILFGIFFTLTMFLFIGYIMPNLGSIVRYRSVYLVFLVTPVICQIDWKRILAFVKLKNN
jgi:hypothetical protein